MLFHFPVCEVHEARRGKSERVCFRHTALATVYTQLQQNASMKKKKIKRPVRRITSCFITISLYYYYLFIFTCNSFLRKDVQYIHFAMLESATYLIFGDQKTKKTNETSLKQVANERNSQDGNGTRVFTAQLNVRWQKYKLRNQTELRPVTLEEGVKREILRTDTARLFSITPCPGIKKKKQRKKGLLLHLHVNSSTEKRAL